MGQKSIHLQVQFQGFFYEEGIVLGNHSATELS